MMVSMAVLFGCLFLVTIHDRNQIRTRLEWIAADLALLLDKKTVDRLAASLESSGSPSPCGAGEAGCGTEPAPASRRAEPEPVQAAATAADWFDTEPEPKANPRSPVAWELEAPSVQLPVTSPWGFSLRGTNVSDEPLEQVQAVLKPDSTGREIALALDVEGSAPERDPVIPAGARFSLVSDATDEDGASDGGAILSFRYVQAGQRKTSILYLTPDVLARVANRQ
jgi:hypothetical protein